MHDTDARGASDTDRTENSGISEQLSGKSGSYSPDIKNPRVRILCVDDEKNVLKALKRLFLDEDYEILMATSAHEGLAILKGENPAQIVISDYKMPQMNGVEFLKEVYAHWPDTVRIVLSGYVDVAAVVSAINEGQIYKFIPKPWDDDELKVTIASAVQKYFLQQKDHRLHKDLQENQDDMQRLNQNLATYVDEKRVQLAFENELLIQNKRILDSLPVGVVSVDAQGVIAQANRQALELLRLEREKLLGLNRTQALSEELNSFLQRVLTEENCWGKVALGKDVIAVQGVRVKHTGGWEGIVLLFYPALP